MRGRGSPAGRGGAEACGVEAHTARRPPVVSISRESERGLRPVSRSGLAVSGRRGARSTRRRCCLFRPDELFEEGSTLGRERGTGPAVRAGGGSASEGCGLGSVSSFTTSTASGTASAITSSRCSRRVSALGSMTPATIEAEGSGVVRSSSLTRFGRGPARCRCLAARGCRRGREARGRLWSSSARLGVPGGRRRARRLGSGHGAEGLPSRDAPRPPAPRR